MALSKQPKSFVKRLLSLDEFVTPAIVRFVYFCGLAFAIIIAIGATLFYIPVMLAALAGKGSLLTFLAPPVFILELVFSVIMWRVYCELILVLFKINSNIERLRRNSDRSAATSERNPE